MIRAIMRFILSFFLPKPQMKKELNLICFRCQTHMTVTTCGQYRSCSCGTKRYEKEFVSLSDVLTSSGTYPERAEHPECTEEIKTNAVILINKVNSLIRDLRKRSDTRPDWITTFEVVSGFRPSDVNGNVPGAAQRSLHMTGCALDLLDTKDQELARFIADNSDLLTKHQLWLENPDYTKGQTRNWVHLDFTDRRRDREVRIFIP